jgi:ketosteroid isomerase-like protein
MHRLLFVLCAALTAAFAFAGSVPKEWTARYAAIDQALKARDTAKFESFLDSSFVSVDSKGAETSRDDFIKMIDEIFNGAAKAAPSVKISSVKSEGDTTNVAFDFHLKVTRSDGSWTAVHEVGTDSWKKIDGDWKLVKTVDKSLKMTNGKPKKKK